MRLSTTPLFSDSSLQAYYQFEGNLNDSKNSFNLTATSPTYTTGKYGQALNAGFGPNITNNLGIASLAGGISLAGWFLAQSAPSGDTCFFTHSNNTSKETITLNFFYNSGSPYIQFFYNSSGHADQTFTYSWNPDTTFWHNIAFTYDATTAIIYVDGRNVASGAITRQNGSGSNSDIFEIQNNPTNPGARTFAADDVAVFSRALTQAEMNSLATDPGGAFMFLIN